MNNIESTSIELVEGGNVFKQGEHITLGYRPYDEKGNTVGLTGKTIDVKLFGRKGIVFEAPATFSDGVMRFTIKDAVIPDGNYQIEFTVTSSTDAGYRRKFPTSSAEKVFIKKSTDDLGAVGIHIITVDQLRSEQASLQQAFEQKVVPQVDELKRRVDDGVGAFTEDTEVVDARMGEPNLRANFEKVNKQLMDEVNFNNYEIQNKTRKVEALFTFTDDDGTKEILTRLVPLQKEFNIPMTAAIIPDRIGRSAYLSLAELMQIYNEGWEISSHTMTHARLGTITNAQQEEEMRLSQETLNGWGIKGVTTICYPFSDTNSYTHIAARKYYRSGRSTDYGINRPPFQTWDINAINGEGKTHTLESMKADIDDIAANGGWGTYITHANLMTDATTAELRAVIEYVLSKGIKIVTYNEALNRMGNLIDVGRYKEDDKTKPHFVAGSDGSVSSHTSPSILVQHPLGGIDAHLLPSNFKKGKIHIAEVLSRNNFLYLGVVVTNTLYPNRASQTLTTDTGVVRTRNEINGAWGPWVEEGTTISLGHDAVTVNTPITGFRPNKITYATVSSHAGLPVSSSGVLVTNTTVSPSANDNNYQEFHNRSTASVVQQVTHRRYWMNNAWQNWHRITPVYSASNSHLRGLTNTAMVSGEMYFSTTNNKPVWRNAANDGWVDATGTAAVL